MAAPWSARRSPGATVDPTAVPWLLLVAASHTGIDGHLTPITSIQRLNTTGGKAPATGCDASQVGARADVPYTATYFFYRTKTRSTTSAAAARTGRRGPGFDELGRQAIAIDDGADLIAMVTW